MNKCGGVIKMISETKIQKLIEEYELLIGEKTEEINDINFKLKHRLEDEIYLNYLDTFKNGERAGYFRIVRSLEELLK